MYIYCLIITIAESPKHDISLLGLQCYFRKADKKGWISFKTAYSTKKGIPLHSVNFWHYSTRNLIGSLLFRVCNKKGCDKGSETEQAQTKCNNWYLCVIHKEQFSSPNYYSTGQTYGDQQDRNTAGRLSGIRYFWGDGISPWRTTGKFHCHLFFIKHTFMFVFKKIT